MNYCIGIVSYLPDGIREQRQKRILDLIDKCSTILPGIDIVIIAQNWDNFTVKSDSNKIVIFKYDKLGIAEARNKLRTLFINSNYDYLIMFDDDNILEGTKENGDKCLSLLKPNGFGIFNWERGQLWGFAISRSLFSQIEYPKQTAEKGEIFEDIYLAQVCKYHYPEYSDLNKSGLKVTELKGLKSTWWNNRKYNLKQMVSNTNDLIEEYKKNNPVIDLVVTYLNSSDTKWINQFNYWKEKELKNNIQNINNAQAFGVERTRNWGDAFKYWFRGVDKNLPWIRYIHLVCFDENHVPKWLDTNNPRLKIHYHRDFIPEAYLPTFNALLIENYMSLIDGLSDYFLVSDDDWYFLNNVDKSMFIRDNKFVFYDDVLQSGKFVVKSNWDIIANNSIDLYKKYSKGGKILRNAHLPFIRYKNNEFKYLQDTSVTEDMKQSKFRNIKDVVVAWASYIDIVNNYNNIIIDKNQYSNCKYYVLNNNINFESCRNKTIVCFNDTEDTKNYKDTNMKLNNFLDSVFSEKCSFEK